MENVITFPERPALKQARNQVTVEKIARELRRVALVGVLEHILQSDADEAIAQEQFALAVEVAINALKAAAEDLATNAPARARTLRPPDE